MHSGGICPVGHYCPEASKTPLRCKLGMYCANSGLDEPTGNCTAGYYCNETSTVPDQYECPMGHYCPKGTGIPVPCPAGTFSDTTGNTKREDCQDCEGIKRSNVLNYRIIRDRNAEIKFRFLHTETASMR